MDNNKRILKLVVAGLLLIGILLLYHYGKPPETAIPWSEHTRSLPADIPEPLSKKHYQLIFSITCYNQSTRAQENSTWDTRHLVTKKDRDKIRRLLEQMTRLTSNDPLSGTEIISLSFLWKGEYYRLDFNETNCPPELQRLFEVAYVSWNPCKENDLQPELTFKPLDTIPEKLDFWHGNRLFVLTWFERPFTGNYNSLIFYPEHYVTNDFLEYRQNVKDNEMHVSTRLTETEQDEINTLLESMTHMDEVTDPNTEDMRITLSFLWQADYYMVDLDSSNCPADLKRLFAITETALRNKNPEYTTRFQNPCQ